MFTVSSSRPQQKSLSNIGKLLFSSLQLFTIINYYYCINRLKWDNLEATQKGNQAQSNHQCLANHQAQASHHCLANHQAQASHHCLANHQVQVSHHFLVDHQAQVSH